LLQPQTIRINVQVLRTIEQNLDLTSLVVQHGGNGLYYIPQHIRELEIYYKVLGVRAVNVQHVAEQVVNKAERVGYYLNIVDCTASSFLGSERVWIVDSKFDEAASGHGSRHRVPDFVTEPKDDKRVVEL
jgi:hypothetical protein